MSWIRAGFGQFSPADVGCLLLTGTVAIAMYFLVKDIVLRPSITAPTTGSPSETSAITATRTIQPSMVLLGTAFDGNAYYFDSPNGIFYRDASTENSIAVARFPDYEALHWSPSRSQLSLVIHNRTDVFPRLYVVNLESPPANREPQLVTHRDANGFPAEFGLRAQSPLAWSQDEQHIAFVAYNQAEKAALFVTDIPTGAVRRLTEGSEPVMSVAWETYTDTQGIVDERIVYVLLQDGKEFTYSIEENGGNNNPWER